MDFVSSLLEIIVHIDKYLGLIINDFGIWAYLILAVIVFCETGLFMAPFLPEESLLFITGALAASGALDIRIITIVLIIANLIGETVNFFIGVNFGQKLCNRENSFLFNKKHISKAMRFYEKHGGKTIIISKYLPLVRTFVPFVAGVCKVEYRQFILYNMIGGIPWVLLFTIGGYFFGNIPIVADNFALVILCVIIISISPGIFSYLRMRHKSKPENKICDCPKMKGNNA